MRTRIIFVIGQKRTALYQLWRIYTNFIVVDWHWFDWFVGIFSAMIHRTDNDWVEKCSLINTRVRQLVTRIVLGSVYRCKFLLLLIKCYEWLWWWQSHSTPVFNHSILGSYVIYFSQPNDNESMTLQSIWVFDQNQRFFFGINGIKANFWCKYQSIHYIHSKLCYFLAVWIVKNNS